MSHKPGRRNIGLGTGNAGCHENAADGLRGTAAAGLPITACKGWATVKDSKTGEMVQDRSQLVMNEDCHAHREGRNIVEV